jgi:integrase
LKCRAAGTITRRLTSITKAHQSAGFDTPATTRHLAVSETLKGIRRTIGTAQKCKTPLLTKDLRKIVDHLPAGLIGMRDRALLLVGYAGGFRRSEVARLAVEDANFTEDGLIITLRHSKTDQEGQGRKIGIPRGSNPDTCPVRSLREWLSAAAIETGALFREVSRHGQVGKSSLHKDSIGLIVKRAAERAGYDPSTLAGHSLRAGLATQAAMNGATELAIMKQTGHRSLAMLRRYIRDGEMWSKNAAATVHRQRRLSGARYVLPAHQALRQPRKIYGVGLANDLQRSLRVLGVQDNEIDAHGNSFGSPPAAPSNGVTLF